MSLVMKLVTCFVDEVGDTTQSDRYTKALVDKVDVSRFLHCVFLGVGIRRRFDLCRSLG